MSVQVPLQWQELARGMTGRGDVEAAQRGLWRAADDYGYVSRNARNGNYGEQTAVDVGRFRQATDMTDAGDNNQIGSKLWPLIWPYIDANGRARFCDQPQSVTPAPKAKRLPIAFGDQSKGVEACQRALWRALPTSTNARNGNYGEQTAEDVERFRELYKVNVGDSGRSIGGELWNVLTRWMDEFALELVDDWHPETPAAGTTAEAACEVALGEVGYVEGAGNQTKYGSWYGVNGQPWCAIFTTWCAEKFGSQAFAKSSRYAYVPYIVADAYAHRNGLRIVAPSAAGKGCLVCFDWEGDGIADHVGFVVAGPGGEGSSFHTVEGNTSPGTSGSQSNGGGVYERTRYVSDVVAFVAFS